MAKRKPKTVNLILPATMVADHRVSPRAMLLYGFLNTHPDATHEELNAFFGAKRGDVWRFLRELRAAGYVKPRTAHPIVLVE